MSGWSNITCPHCGSTESQGVSHIHPALSNEHTAEQEVMCLGCYEEYVVVFDVVRAVPLAESTIFSK